MLHNFTLWIKKAGTEQYPLPLLAVICIVLGGLILFFILPEKQLSIPEQVAEIVKSGKISRCARVHGAIINGIDYETVCRNNVAYRLAFKRGDVSYCKKLDDVLLSVAQCESDVLRLMINKGAGVAVCVTAGISNEARSSCEREFWFRESVAKKDIALCDNIAEGMVGRDGCRINFWIKRLIADPGEVSCRVFSGSLRLDCEEFSRAVSEPQKERCSAIHNEEIRARCGELISR